MIILVVMLVLSIGCNLIALWLVLSTRHETQRTSKNFICSINYWRDEARRFEEENARLQWELVRVIRNRIHSDYPSSEIN